jgi:Tfp pilus assembly protein FimT
MPIIRKRMKTAFKACMQNRGFRAHGRRFVLIVAASRISVAPRASQTARSWSRKRRGKG